MPRSSWANKGQQRTVTVIENKLAQLVKVGRVNPVPLGNLAAKSDIRTRGAQISFEVVSLEGIDHFVLMRNFSRDPGSAQIIKTWPVGSLKTTPQILPVALRHVDNDPAIGGKIAYYWVKAVPASGRTQGNEVVSGPQQFDASQQPSALQITGDFATTQSYTPTTQPLTAVTGGPVNAATINIASFQIQYPFDTDNDGDGDLVTYSSGAITPLLDGTTYFVYFDDPTYAGGPQTYIASTSNPDVTGGLHRQYLGKITTPAHGGGGTGGGGGGSGPCFSGNTLVRTKRGALAIADIQLTDRIYSRRGWRSVAALLIHSYEGEMLDMGAGELVTPEHRIYKDGLWLQARELFTKTVPFKGQVFNLALPEAKSDDGHCFLLGNGWMAHNVFKA